MAARTSHGLIVIVMTGSLLSHDKDGGWRQDGELECRCSDLRDGEWGRGRAQSNKRVCTDGRCGSHHAQPI